MSQIEYLTSPTLPKLPEVEYPESDGQPMGETGFHVKAILNLYNALLHFFSQAADVYVVADMFMYYEEGNPRANKVPDVLVAKGVSKEERRIYKVWEEMVAPCTIFEITSKSTRTEDLTVKKDLYERLGVEEYFLFDPLDEYLVPRLQGFRLQQDTYQAIAIEPDGTLISQTLGLRLRSEDIILRIIDLETGEPVPTIDEAVSRMVIAQERAKYEAQRAENEAQRAETEAQRAENEAQRAENEAQRAESAEAKLSHTEAELAALRRQLQELHESQADNDM
jgi:Uma2 family endonuclease